MTHFTSGMDADTDTGAGEALLSIHPSSGRGSFFCPFGAECTENDLGPKVPEPLPGNVTGKSSLHI